MRRTPSLAPAARICFLAGLTTASLAAPALISFMHRQPKLAGRAPAATQPSPSPDPEPVWEPPKVNYRGPVYLIRDTGDDHPAPEVFPRKPLDIVTDDCSSLEMFNTDDEAWDPENGLIILSWLDIANESRSLTIYTGSPSCTNNPSVRRELSFLDAGGL